MDVREFMHRFLDRYPDVDRFGIDGSREIEAFEAGIGVKLPQSYKQFISEFSNGIFLLDCEPIGGISEVSPCGQIRKSKMIIPDLPDRIWVRETGERFDADRLISLTTFDAAENSNDHWVFLCEDGVDRNEYRLGFISQRSKVIVQTLPSFEEWLTIFWDHDDVNGVGVPVFHALYPTIEERNQIL